WALMRILLIALVVFMWGASGPYLAPVAQVSPFGLANCAMHDQMVSRLNQRYDEQKIGDGLNSRGIIIEILVSPAGTFTILETNTN
ncbi:hypothetical protein, partial [Isoptericola croceus]|uniref:hypothetical protein n=1 Tax=Isoptericola croceus TaxID=3031406 RepID=UPI0023F650D4